MKNKNKHKYNRIIAIAVVVFSLICIPFSTVVFPQDTEASTVSVSIIPEYKQTAARAMLSPLNSWRAQRNWYYTSSNKVEYVSSLPALKYDYTLEKYAMQRAAEIAVNFDHLRPNGTRSSGLVGNGYGAIGENIFASTSSNAEGAVYVLNRFKEEDQTYAGQGHRRNMLSFTWTSSGRKDLNYNAVGFACVKYGKTYYWVQIFGRATNGVNTSATTALNATRETYMTLDTSQIRKKSSTDFGTMSNTSLIRGSSVVLPNAHVNITLPDTWPVSSVSVSDALTWTSGNSGIVTVTGNTTHYAYGSGVGTVRLTAKDAINNTSKSVTYTVKNSNVRTGWVREGSAWHFYRNGKKMTGWVYLSYTDGERVPHWSYFDKNNGNLYTGWHYMTSKEGEKTPHWSYFGSNGWLRTGWQLMGTSSNPDGRNGQHWSYFGSNGWLRTGWVQLGKGTSEPDGNKARHWSYFGSNGWLRTGWVRLGKGTSEPDGNKPVHWSYFGSNGWLRTGWQVMGTSTNPDGRNKQHWSYFGSRGWLATGRYLINNRIYTFSTGGWLLKPTSP